MTNPNVLSQRYTTPEINRIFSCGPTYLLINLSASLTKASEFSLGLVHSFLVNQ